MTAVADREVRGRPSTLRMPALPLQAIQTEVVLEKPTPVPNRIPGITTTRRRAAGQPRYSINKSTIVGNRNDRSPR